jgi:hypothetical protein
MRARIVELQAKLARVTAERDKLRRAYELAKEQLELLRRRIFVAKAERVDVQQLELEFAEKKAALERLATQLEEPAHDEPPAQDDDLSAKAKPKGRRNLAAIPMAEERVEVLDPALEGVAERIGFEESYRLAYRRGGPVRVVLARATYKTTAAPKYWSTTRARLVEAELALPLGHITVPPAPATEQQASAG